MQEASYKDVANYYDGLWAQLEKESIAGINSRHRIILNKLKKAGLKPNSVLLEIGCGIGILSSFIAKSLPNGKITAVDISPASVEFAKKKYSDFKNLDFLVSDMTNFQFQGKFDFILFPDVLEHIPVGDHQNIFNTIAKLVHENSKVLINLPNPRCIRWFLKNDPKALQIIDQDIETDVLINKLYPLGFYLEKKETYALYFNVPDYEWFEFRKNKEFESVIKKPKFSVLISNLVLRISNLLS